MIPSHPDDAPRGRLLTRAEMLSLLGVGAASLALPSRARAATPSCIARPQLTEGPFYLDKVKQRSDIRTDLATGEVKEGALLKLRFNVSRLADGECRPLPGAMVDVWHCDAVGSYSGVGDAEGQTFLRGYQVCDTDGAAQFTTIYPGWYPGRAVHIHFKVRPAAHAQEEFTSQLFFADALSDNVYAQPPYRARGEGRQRNEDDGIFRRDGAQLMLDVARTETGYAAIFDIALA